MSTNQRGGESELSHSLNQSAMSSGKSTLPPPLIRSLCGVVVCEVVGRSLSLPGSVLVFMQVMAAEAGGGEHDGGPEGGRDPVEYDPNFVVVCRSLSLLP